MRYSIIYLVVFLLLWFKSLNADTIPDRYLGFQAHYGFIIPHSEAIEPVSHTNPFGFDLSLNKLHQSYDEWKVFNAYWISGVMAGYFNFQNPDVLGDAYLLTFFAEPVLKSGKKFMFSIRMGAGFSYHRMVYDEEDNPTNQFFSTHINFPLFVNARFRLQAGEQTYFTLSACYNHISNGGFKQPNKGMNFPTLAVGLERSREPFPALARQYSRDRAKIQGMNLTMQFLSSIKVVDEDQNYPEQAEFIYGIHSRFTKPLGHIYSLNAGAEMIIDNYIKETIEREGESTDHKRVALTLGQDFHFGQVIFTQYFGFYVYAPYEAKNSVYQKYELAYRLHENLLAGVFLKAHAQVAELMGITLNYQLPLAGKKDKSKAGYTYFDNYKH